MIITLLFGVMLVGLSCVLVLRAILLSRGRTVDTLETIDSYGYASAASAAAAAAAGVERTGGRTVFDELASYLGNVLARHIGPKQEAEVRRQLMAAGYYSTPPRRFMGYRVFSVVGLTLLYVWYMSVGDHSTVMLVLTTPLAAAGSWFVPLTLLRMRARRRIDKVDRALPELIDLLTVTVEAGLAFSASLREATDRLGGPLGDELRLTLQEQRMGLSLDEAIRNMLVRADTPAMRSFVRSVLQAETLGVSIGQIMRSLAIEMRKRRRASAEERAQKAPVKLLFPLVFLIFPALFLVVLYPAVSSFLTTFSGF
jgi:tight adherence protein C